MDPVAILNTNPVDAAAALLGYTLLCESADGTVGGVIVETEAYWGEADPASHAFRGVTPRTAPMFEAAGTVYVYRSYGIHLCLNLVTGGVGEAGAVLLRALEPTVGLGIMAARRRQTDLKLFTTGPGRLGQALGLTPADSGDHIGRRFRLVSPKSTANFQIGVSGRVGIRSAVDFPWRFYIKDNLYVSRP